MLVVVSVQVSEARLRVFGLLVSIHRGGLPTYYVGASYFCMDVASSGQVWYRCAQTVIYLTHCNSSPFVQDLGLDFAPWDAEPGPSTAVTETDGRNRALQRPKDTRDRQPRLLVKGCGSAGAEMPLSIWTRSSNVDVDVGGLCSNLP